MQKKSWMGMDYESWFLNLKGTPLEAQAVSLLEQYYTIIRDESMPNNSQTDSANQIREQLANVEYELNMLNLKRMQCAKPGETVIVIRAYRSEKEACVSGLEEILDSFRGTKFEAQAVKLIKEKMMLEKQMNELYQPNNDNYDKMFELERAMEELSIQALQQELETSIVDETGLDIAPNMAADVISLMEGVSMDEPLEPTHEMPMGLYAKRAQELSYDEPERSKEEVLDDALAMAKAMRKSPPETIAKTLSMVFGLSDKDAQDLAQWSRKGSKEDESEEHPLEELGEVHEGKDIAEVPISEMPFALGDKVTLSKAYPLTLWGGGTEELAKGTKGLIKSLYDGHGDSYMVSLEDGPVYRIPTEFLK